MSPTCYDLPEVQAFLDRNTEATVRLRSGREVVHGVVWFNGPLDTWEMLLLGHKRTELIAYRTSKVHDARARLLTEVEARLAGGSKVTGLTSSYDVPPWY